MAAKTRYRPAIHPGVSLKEDLLAAHGMSVNQLAKALKVPANRLTAIIKGTRAITADTSLRLGLYFGFSPEFWYRLQMDYEMERAKRESLDKLKREIRPRQAA
jgi:addiction module HigA family antidote